MFFIMVGNRGFRIFVGRIGRRSVSRVGSRVSNRIGKRVDSRGVSM